MKLADVRRVAIRDQVAVRFPLPDGKECIVDRHGVARVPGLDAAPAFRLEEELAKAERFIVAPEGGAPREVTRAALEQLSGGGGAAQADDHDE